MQRPYSPSRKASEGHSPNHTYQEEGILRYNGFMDPVLDVSHLTKTFPTPTGIFSAVDDISFSIKEGEIVGLLGPNGAGKTTTIQMLLGLITPTAGTIKYFGRDLARNREECLAKINYSSAYSHMQGKLTVMQDLMIYAGLYNVAHAKKRIGELIEILDVKETLNQLFWKLSSGQKTRVNLVKSLLNFPKLLLMDEPTASLDPEIVDKILTLIVDMQQKEGVAILYTSHNMTEVERICDRVIFLDHGKIVEEDTPLGLSKRVGDALLRITYDGNKDSVHEYLYEGGYMCRFLNDNHVEIHLPETEIPKALFGLSGKGVWLTDIDIQKPSLEDVFLSIVKGTMHES